MIRRPASKERPIAKAQPPSGKSAGQRLRRAGRRSAPPPGAGTPAIDNLIVIGASAGGLKALTTILESIPQDIPAAIVFMLHQRGDCSFEMERSVARMTHLPIVTVGTGAPLRHGHLYVPTAGRSLLFRGREVFESGVQAKRKGPFRSINDTFSHAAETYGDRVIGVVLTGMLADGTEGLRAIHDRGGITIVQDPKGAEHPQMPSNAMRGLPVTFCLALPELGLALDLLARRSGRLESGIAASVRMLKDRVELLSRLRAQSGDNSGTSDFLGEELTVLKRDLESVARLLESAPARSRR